MWRDSLLVDLNSKAVVADNDLHTNLDSSLSSIIVWSDHSLKRQKSTDGRFSGCAETLFGDDLLLHSCFSHHLAPPLIERAAAWQYHRWMKYVSVTGLDEVVDVKRDELSKQRRLTSIARSVKITR